MKRTSVMTAVATMGTRMYTLDGKVSAQQMTKVRSACAVRELEGLEDRGALQRPAGRLPGRHGEGRVAARRAALHFTVPTSVRAARAQRRGGASLAGLTLSAQAGRRVRR